MSTRGLLDLLARVASVLDDLEIPYALGGSVASSFFGEPRATADIDVAVQMDSRSGEAFLARVQPEFYVPMNSARAALESCSSFNLLDAESGLKVDLFVLGDGLLDRRQIERRVPISLSGSGAPLWVTSPEDQILRKLEWFRAGGEASDRQWRDIVGLILVRADNLDVDDLRRTADEVGLAALLDRALGDVRLS